MSLDRRRAKTVCKVVSIIAIMTLSTAGWGDSFPNRTVKLITGGAAGSVTDSIARRLADELSAAWGQPVVVEDKPGAGGILAMQLVAKAPADGYTLGIASTSQLVFNEYLFTKLPYDTERELTPISELVSGGAVIVANPSFPADSLADLIAIAKAKPADVQYAIPQLGSPPHVIALTLWRAANVDLSVVPFRNAGDSLASVLHGDIPILVDAPPLVAQYVRTGALKALVVTGRERSPLLPSTPTLAESGFASVRGEAWVGVVGPAQIPTSSLNEINARISQVLQSAELRHYYETNGWRVVGSSMEQFAATIRTDRADWGKVIEDTGIKLE